MGKTILFLRRLAVSAAVSGCVAASAFAQSVAFVEPVNGATVSSPFKVKFAVNGMEVKPAGEMAANTGHHHLLINAEAIKEGESVPFNDTHLHFGKGQTETEVKLAPGVYTLTLQFANGAHQSYGAGLSNTIKVTVK
ncbi:DUF4399 domain-containing protein [Janthinobacterium fluminis]|uniref:DUF4399 domain-containing protein n=1 Tax=Janthinobacterium fluminis TaxID=2987524 RepID=A0ABT5K0L7_9BURK|nr:DUF4399 domain-containing protein [Janthinobacterium fluminis]MDC8758508.1 DUF4399 domain-containing protein [Janthinobacterium fluminis]